MKLADFPALTKLPKRQRLRLAEELWFSGVDDSLPVSASHRQLLDERWDAHRTGRARRLTLAELQRRLTRKR
jgi:putative addiction module component (TIGR02574 family)